MSDEDELFDTIQPKEVPMTCLGLDMQCGDTIGIPIAAFAIVKHIEGGDAMYTLIGTDSLDDVETLGMLDFARMRFHHLLNRAMDFTMEPGVQDDVEE